jgi:ABC-type uncharacterized transport system substrate-binding protein
MSFRQAPANPSTGRGPRGRVARWLVPALLVATCAAATTLRAAEPEQPRVGVFVFDDRPEYEAAFAGLREGFRLAGIEPSWVERRAGGDAREASVALDLMRIEKLDLVFALGDGAAVRARAGFRRGYVVYTAVGDPDALGLTGAENACGTASAISAAEVAATLRRAVPGLERLAVVVPEEDRSAEAALRRIESAFRGEGVGGSRTVVRATPRGTTAERRAAAILHDLPADVRAVWLPRSVSDSDAGALAAALAGKGILLAGATPAHLEAGCALALCADERRLGTLAVALARRVLAGASPQSLPVRRLARARVRLNLIAADQMGWQAPLGLLARADSVIVAPVRRPR